MQFLAKNGEFFNVSIGLDFFISNTWFDTFSNEKNNGANENVRNGARKISKKYKNTKHTNWSSQRSNFNLSMPGSPWELYSSGNRCKSFNLAQVSIKMVTLASRTSEIRFWAIFSKFTKSEIRDLKVFERR